MVSPVLLTLVSLLSAQTTLAIPCVVQDVNWNLLAFGYNGKDYNAGTQDSWNNAQVKDITTSGRPPFDADNTVCYLSEFQNAIYVTNGDKSNPNAVHIYDATAKSWTTQKTSGSGSFNPSNFTAILDHDTNVFYALSGGDLYSLDMSSLKASNGASIGWVDQKTSPYGANYNPVMALANNHVHFINVPNSPDGDAYIFVIHFSYFQPDPQSYPVQGGGNIPETHGQTASLFIDSGVQPGFAFIPDDGSNTYIVNVETNSTQKMAGPPVKSAGARYFAGPTAVLQVASNGAVAYVPYSNSSSSANAQATWSSISAIPTFSAATSSGGSSSGNSSSGGGGGSSSGNSSSGSNGGSNSNQHSAAVRLDFALALVTAPLVAAGLTLLSMA